MPCFELLKLAEIKRLAAQAIASRLLPNTEAATNAPVKDADVVLRLMRPVL
jgi:hypothetical protein